MPEKKYHLQGSSLIEVLTGFSILSLVFLIALKAFGLITGRYSPSYQLKTRLLMREMIYETIIQHNTNNETKEIQGRFFTKDITLISPDSDLYQITITCYRGQTPTARRSFITTLRQYNYENDSKTHAPGFYPPGNDGRHVSHGYHDFVR